MSKLSKAINRMNKLEPIRPPLDQCPTDSQRVVELKKRLVDIAEKVKNTKK